MEHDGVGALLCVLEAKRRMSFVLLPQVNEIWDHRQLR